MLHPMTNRRLSGFRTFSFLRGLLLLIAAPGRVVAEPPPAAIAAFGAYTNAVELRLDRQHRAANGFLALDGQGATRLRQSELSVERLTPASANMPGAMLHHWRGTAFATGATAADFERVMRNFGGYPVCFAPQVLQAKVLVRQDDRMQGWMRVRQKHVITVVMDTTYDVTFGRLDAGHGYSASRSTRIAEIGSPGTAREHVLSASEEHGFLWRLNTTGAMRSGTAACICRWSRCR